MENKSKQQIFNLQQELPAPANEEEKVILLTVDQISQKIATLLLAGHRFPEAELHQLFALQEQVYECAQAGCVLGFIFLDIEEYAAMRDMFARLVEGHGELPPLLFYQAVGEQKLGNLSVALELLQKIVQQGVRNYYVFMECARLQQALGEFSASSAMANLAILDNEGGFPDPFVLLAQNFKQSGEINRMLESFSRIEQLKGRDGLAVLLGDLYEEYQELYQKVGTMLRETK